MNGHGFHWTPCSSSRGGGGALLVVIAAAAALSGGAAAAAAVTELLLVIAVIIGVLLAAGVAFLAWWVLKGRDAVEARALEARVARERAYEVDRARRAALARERRMEEIRATAEANAGILAPILAAAVAGAQQQPQPVTIRGEVER